MKRAGETEVPTLVPDGGEEETREIPAAYLVRKYNGSYAKLRALRPSEGAIDKSGFTVVKTVLTKKPGGQGLLTITYAKSNERSWEGVDTRPVKDVIRIGWERVQRPLRTHPKFAAIGDITTWAQVDAWEKEDDYDLKSTYQYRVPSRDTTTKKWLHDEFGEPVYEIRTVSASLQKYCDRRLKGVESWDDFRPVVRRIRVYSVEPSTGACGSISTTCPRSISGYVFMKVADDITNEGQKGMWTRSEAWEGAAAFDALLYGSEEVAGKAPPLPKRGGRAASK